MATAGLVVVELVFAVRHMDIVVQALNIAAQLVEVVVVKPTVAQRDNAVRDSASA